MRLLSMFLLGWVAGCGAPAPPPTLPLPAPPPPIASPSASSVAAPPPDLPRAPALPLHRFAALVPGQTARLFMASGRLILQAGDRLFSLSAGQMHRETALEKALAGPTGHLGFGAIGGRYPDGIVADRQSHGAAKGSTVRQYVRIAHGKATEIARAKPDPQDTQSYSALQIAVLPDDRVLGRFEFAAGEGNAGWADFVPGTTSAREAGLHGLTNATWLTPSLLRRADGSVVMAWALADQNLQLLTWAKGAPEPTQKKLALDDGERPSRLFETTDGALFLLTDKGLRKQSADGWPREASGVEIRGAWPLPGGAALLVTNHGEPLVRGASGALTRASWPLVTIEGRQFRVTFADALCTRESGFWAIAGDGMGLYHDKAPPEVIDVSKLPPSAAAKAPGGAR